MKNIASLITLSFILVFIFESCKENTLEPECDGSMPTYDADVKALIDDNCTNAACHASGSPRGDFTAFATLKPDLDNGKFEERVLTKQNMPKGSATLTQAQLNMLQCWVESGYPEN